MLTQIKFLDTELEKAIHHLEPLGSPFAMVSIAIFCNLHQVLSPRKNDPEQGLPYQNPRADWYTEAYAGEIERLIKEGRAYGLGFTLRVPSQGSRRLTVRVLGGSGIRFGVQAGLRLRRFLAEGCVSRCFGVWDDEERHLPSIEFRYRFRGSDRTVWQLTKGLFRGSGNSGQEGEGGAENVTETRNPI